MSGQRYTRNPKLGSPVFSNIDSEDTSLDTTRVLRGSTSEKDGLVQPADAITTTTTPGRIVQTGVPRAFLTTSYRFGTK